MYEIKKQIFLEFTKNQKASICAYLKAFVKKNQQMDCENIFNKFTEDEKYYLEMEASRFPFLADFIDTDAFLKDVRVYIKECKKYYDYKQTQKPLIEAQKAFNKMQRKRAQEIKMSKELPTKKQLYYYEKLCQRYNLAQMETKELSRLDLKNMIERVLDEHKRDYENIDE